MDDMETKAKVYQCQTFVDPDGRGVGVYMDGEGASVPADGLAHAVRLGGLAIKVRAEAELLHGLPVLRVGLTMGETGATRYLELPDCPERSEMLLSCV